MNAEQKRAWFLVVVFGVACVGFIVSGLILGFRGAWGFFGLLGLAGLTPFIWRGEKPDERDLSIRRRAVLAAGMLSYLTFVLSTVAVYFVAYTWRQQAMVSVDVFPAITLAGGVVFYLAYSVTVLVLYGRHVEGDHA